MTSTTLSLLECLKMLEPHTDRIKNDGYNNLSFYGERHSVFYSRWYTEILEKDYLIISDCLIQIAKEAKEKRITIRMFLCAEFESVRIGWIDEDGEKEEHYQVSKNGIENMAHALAVGLCSAFGVLEK